MVPFDLFLCSKAFQKSGLYYNNSSSTGYLFNYKSLLKINMFKETIFLQCRLAV